MERLPGHAARLSAALFVAFAIAAAPALAQDSAEEALSGFDDEATAEPSDSSDVDDALSGFDEAPAAESDALEDVLDGFDDDATEASTTADASPERFWDLSGSVSLGASINVIPHRSSLGPGDDAAEILSGTDYLGVQRLRSRGDLQLDVDLPAGWELRAQGFMWFDFAYLIHGRDSYTDSVLNDYEFVAEVLDLWVSGTLFDRLDVKLGRQVVNWGRSDTLRVTDVLNSLDNREPGLTDIENLRLPSTMAKLDYYVGPWSFTAIVVPEIRHDYNPPPGSDFFNLPNLGDLPPPLPPVLPPIDPDALDFEDQRTAQWGSNPEYAGSIDGIFSGWDVSFNVARIYQNRSSLTPAVPGSTAQNLIETDRVTMIGGGGNYTWGSWLFKTELAWFKDVDYAFLRPIPAPAYYEGARTQSNRVDFMGGVEYYGLVDTTIAVEIVNRHIIDYDPLYQYFPNYVEENSVEYALRVSNEWMNSRLDTTLLALVIGSKAQGGAILRAQVDYDLLDALVLSGGFVAYVPSRDPPLSDWGKNQRIFAKLKYSF